MNRTGRAAMLLVLGLTTGHLLWSGDFGWFVQQRMLLPLVGATAVLVVFGVFEAIRGDREERRDPESARRPVAPGVGWLMILPIVVLLSVAPTGLGASAAGRVDAYVPTETAARFAPLDTGGGPIPMRVFEFLDRALWDEERSLEGTTVRLEGIVVNDPDVPGTFLLTRFLVSCCAADGVPLQVTVHARDTDLDDDTWVAADVTWCPPDTPYQDEPLPWIVEADAVSVTVMPDPPKDPYESPY